MRTYRDNMARLRKSIATTMIVWLTVLSHAAVAMPLCALSQAARASHVQAAQPSGHEACLEHRSGKRVPSGVQCDACALCHVACNIVPSVAIDLAFGAFDSDYFAFAVAPPPSFFPDTPEPVPVALFA